MDDIVLRAIAKWPNVASAYGWLGLDRRGNWSLKGERISNATVNSFINRNYAADSAGRWFFQNGPQRVFVNLAYTPFVYRTHPTPAGLTVMAHTGTPARALLEAYIDEIGAIVLRTDVGPGVLHDQDLADIVGCLTRADGQGLADRAIDDVIRSEVAGSGLRLQLPIGNAAVAPIRSEQVPKQFGFDPVPRPAAGEPDC